MPPFGNPHLGLVPENARQFAQDLRIAFDDDLIADAAEVITGLRARGGNLSSDEAGRLLSLTKAEREAVRAWSIDAAEEPSDARRLRKAAEKRDRDRVAAKAKRAAKRAASGRPPFDPQRPTIAQARPWLELGMSRAKFYRLSAKGLITLSSASETHPSRTYVERVSETRPSPTYEYETHGRRVSLTVAGGMTSSRASEGGAHSPRPSDGGARRPASLAEISRAETSILLLLGRGDADEGRRVASMIDPASIRQWIAAVRNGTLSGDERVDLEFVRIRTMQTMRQAS